MYGVVTRNAEEASWPEFDRTFYEVKSPAGRHTDPVPETTSVVACFADTATAETAPELAAVDDAGRAATRDHPALDAGHVCPRDEHYREGLLETVAEAAAVSGDVRLDDVGYPGESFCHCERCAETDRRTEAVTEFVAAAADSVEGTTHLSLPPDPYPGHLRARWGIDLDAVSSHVDEFVVPLYASSYGETYWVESLVRGFADRLDAPLAVELYAAGADVDALVAATETVSPHADHVYFGYESGAARATLRRMRAERREGERHGPE